MSNEELQQSSKRILQNFYLVWLDEKFNRNDPFYCDCIAQLQQVINTVYGFVDIDECIDFITNQPETTFMLVSQAFIMQLIPIMESVSQIKSIYVFGSNISNTELTEKYSKIIGNYKNIQPICEKIQQDSNDCDLNAISISFTNSTTIITDIDDNNNNNNNNNNKDSLNCSFMYTQLLKDILLNIDFNADHFNEFLSYCRLELAGNTRQLRNVEKIEKEYKHHNPIWWYTYESFLYQMLNKALRLMDVDIIVKIGFFLRDLHERIAFLHFQQYNGSTTSNSFTVYRGQHVFRTDFYQLKQNTNGLLAFNNFLSTTKNRDVAMRFIRRNLTSSDLVPVLFIVQIDPSIQTTPFAHIAESSAVKREEEILFSMHSVFRIEQVKQIDTSIKFWEIQLTLTSDHDPKLSQLTEIMLEDTKQYTGWHQLASLMVKIAKYDKAEELYKILLTKSSSEGEKVYLLCCLGNINNYQGQYIVAIEYYEKSLEINLRQSHHETSNISAAIYRSMGLTYDNMGDHSRAFEYYEKSSEISKISHPDNPCIFAQFYNSMGDYSKALEYCKKSLEIRKKTLPDIHPDLATSYRSMGSIYSNMCNYFKALEYYEKSLEINKKALPDTHLDLAIAYQNVGLMHDKLRNYSKALEYYEKSLEIRKKTLPDIHPDLATSYRSMGSIYSNMCSYFKALEYYEKLLEINKKILPDTHLDLAMYYNNIGHIYFRLYDYSKSIKCYEKSLEIGKKNFSENDFIFSHPYNNMGYSYLQKGDHRKALECFECALNISQRSLPSDHQQVIDLQKMIVIVRKNL